MSSQISMGALGKLPASPEFVRLGASGEPLGRFDAWLTDNMAFFAARNDGWEAAWHTAPVHAFVFRAPGSDAFAPLVAGAVAPSEDSAGRRFPLALVSSVVPTPEVFRAPEALPILLEDLWQRAGDLLLDARSWSKDELALRVAAERLVLPDNVGEAIGSYHAWLNEVPVSDLSRLLYGAPPSEGLLLAVAFALEALRPLRGSERPRTPLTLRLPLGSAAGAAVCFWIDVVRRLGRWTSTVPSHFWSHDGEGGELFLHLGDSARFTLSELWVPTGRRDEVCDLASSAPARRGIEEAHARLERVCGDGSLSALRLLELLASDAI